MPYVITQAHIMYTIIFIGKYMYVEATGRSPGDNAKLQLALPGSNSSSCLTFYYHMYGSSMGTLNVFNGNVTIFSKSGDQGNYWVKVTRAVNLSDVVSNISITVFIICATLQLF